ncbi:MAG: hypothetical protein FJ102_14860 [Deltaproteobacteria bacterium]|nr:hypothetical protein [Deltaproteobacteria bacterium]
MSNVALRLAIMVWVCGATGCGETCIPSGEPITITLLEIAVGSWSAPSPYAVGSDEEAREFSEQWGLEFELPELPAGWSFVFLGSRVTPYGHMEWVTGALDDGPDHFVLLIDSDFPCEGDANDTAVGDAVVAVWEVPHAGEVTACRNGRRCH